MTQQKVFQNILRKSGYKATPARIAILSLLKKSRNPLSAQEIIELVPKGVDQATVYRTLKSLKTKGVVRQIDLRHNHAHYELTDIADHHHLICTRCGRIEDVHQCGVEEMQTAILRNAKHFSEIQQHTLEFYGVCKVCARKNEAASVVPHRKITP